MLGETAYRSTREAFLQKRAAERANARLAVLSEGLSRTVEVRTAELRSLALHLDKAREAERHRIARDLHDDLGQELAAMRYSLARLAPRVDEPTQPLVEDLDALVDSASQTVRGFVSSLRPRILDDLGLLAAAEWLTEQVARTTAVTCTLHATDAFRATAICAESSLVLFRVLQESSTNALKHAAPSHIRLSLDARDGTVLATVTDDGKGFDPTAPRQGFGLLGLEERVRATGGALTLDTAPGRGARICAQVPVELS